jgi:hypothetical protein
MACQCVHFVPALQVDIFRSAALLLRNSPDCFVAQNRFPGCRLAFQDRDAIAGNQASLLSIELADQVGQSIVIDVLTYGAAHGQAGFIAVVAEGERGGINLSDRVKRGGGQNGHGDFA